MSKFRKALVGAMVLSFAFVFVASQADAQMYSWTRALKQGSSGEDVRNLQKFLNMCPDTMVSTSGAGSPGMETTYFGPATKAAVMKFQSARGVYPAAGYFGPLSQAKAMELQASGNVCGGVTTPTTPGGSSGLPSGCLPGYTFSPTTGQACTPGTPTSPTTPSLSGGFGTISSITQLSQYNNEEVGAGSDAVKVMGFEIEASDEGDIQIQAVKLVFDSTGNSSGDSDRIQDYLENVSVWVDSTKVGDDDVQDFTKVSTGVYSKNVILSNAVVKSGKKAKFYVAVDAIGNLDSGDIDSDSWTIGLENVRVVDGSGVTTTDADSAPSAIEYNTAGDGVGISFVSFSSASDTELKISTDNTPDSATVAVETSDNTDDVLMLKGEIEIEGDSDVWLDELPVTLTSTGDSIAAITGNITLTIDGQTFSESVTNTSASSATVTFNDLDLTLDAGQTVDFSITADINDLEDTGAAATDFDAGDQLTISLTTTNRASIIAENEQGDQLTDGTEMTGSAVGNAMTFRSEGVNVVMGTPTYGKTSDTNGVVTQLTYTIPVAVTAFGNKLYMGQSGQFAATATASNAFAIVFENSTAPTTADVTSSAAVALSTSNALIETNGYALDEGVTKNFTIEVTLNTPGYLGAVTAGNYRVRLDEIRVFTNAGLESAATATNVDLTPTSDYRTDFKYITS